MERRSASDGELGWHRVDSGLVRSLPNRGDGDCLFQALSHQLEGQYLAPQLREMAVNFMATHLEDFGPQLIDLGEEMLTSGEIPMAAAAAERGLGLPELVLNTLRLPWIWGGAECIAAISNALRRPIRVYLEEGATIVFEPNITEGPALRILHRFGGEERRTHYESVLQWQVQQPADAELPPQPASEQQPPLPAAEHLPPLPPDEVVVPVPSDEPPLKKIRRSPRLVSPAIYSSFRSENFSEPEDCPSDVPERLRKYRKCVICDRMVGRYTLLCGCYPACGICIRQWFIENSNNCTRCGGQVQGWFKVFNQN